MEKLVRRGGGGHFHGGGHSHSHGSGSHHYSGGHHSGEHSSGGHSSGHSDGEGNGKSKKSSDEVTDPIQEVQVREVVKVLLTLRKDRIVLTAIITLVILRYFLFFVLS